MPAGFTVSAVLLFTVFSRTEAVPMPVLSDQFQMPVIGYGTWQSTGRDLESGVDEALKAGYRHIDCAAAYENEHIIGKVLNEWLSSGRVKREELFIVSKLPAVAMKPYLVEKYLNETLKNLRVDYIDHYLVHVPFAFREGPEMHPFDSDGAIILEKKVDHVSIWKEMEKQVESGKTKSIGVSNFNETQIQRIVDNSKIKPANIQVEMHLYFQQKKLRQFCKSKGITVTAYSPLGTRGSVKLFTALGDTRQLPDLFNQPFVKEMSNKYDKTPGQILLRHLVQNGVSAIPKSTSPKHIQENIQIFDFTLTAEEMEKLNALDQGEAGRILDFKIFKGVLNHPEYPFHKQ